SMLIRPHPTNATTIQHLTRFDHTRRRMVFWRYNLSMGLVAIAVVLSSMHYEGDVTAAGGDYVDVAFDVPVGTVEIQITHTDGSADVILDWGVWEPGGKFRGWGGGNT